MVVKSAGVIMVRFNTYTDNSNNIVREPLFLCVKPGGPWKNMEWSIPKGGKETNDKTLKDTGIREYEEETGQIAPENDLIPIGSIKQRKGKVVYAWYFVDNSNEPIKFRSNSYTIEHPKGSGKIKTYKEAVNHRFLNEDDAKTLLISSQFEFIKRIRKKLEETNLI